jgi:phosphate transport system permease protein
VTLPAARSGIAAGILLAAGRAIGETMAVLMVAGNVVEQPHSLFDSVRTLTANIALEMAYATGDHRAALFVSGMALMSMVLVLVGLAEFFTKERRYV